MLCFENVKCMYFCVIKILVIIKYIHIYVKIGNVYTLFVFNHAMTIKFVQITIANPINSL